jgi:F0F1-type ATP synthase membrane subunit a
MPATTAAILLTLMFAATVYAITLEHLRERYVPNWTWLTVVVGNSLILAALWSIEALAEPLTFGLALLCNVAAGGPIIVWQLWQMERRRRRRMERERAATHKGGASGAR